MKGRGGRSGDAGGNRKRKAAVKSAARKRAEIPLPPAPWMKKAAAAFADAVAIPAMQELEAEGAFASPEAARESLAKHEKKLAAMLAGSAKGKRSAKAAKRKGGAK